jgi:hypothetical protein
MSSEAVKRAIFKVKDNLTKGNHSGEMTQTRSHHQLAIHPRGETRQ